MGNEVSQDSGGESSAVGTIKSASFDDASQISVKKSLIDVNDSVGLGSSQLHINSNFSGSDENSVVAQKILNEIVESILKLHHSDLNLNQKGILKPDSADNLIVEKMVQELIGKVVFKLKAIKQDDENRFEWNKVSHANTTDFLPEKTLKQLPAFHCNMTSNRFVCNDVISVLEDMLDGIEKNDCLDSTVTKTIFEPSDFYVEHDGACSMGDQVKKGIASSFDDEVVHISDNFSAVCTVDSMTDLTRVEDVAAVLDNVLVCVEKFLASAAEVNDYSVSNNELGDVDCISDEVGNISVVSTEDSLMDINTNSEVKHTEDLQVVKATLYSVLESVDKKVNSKPKTVVSVDKKFVKSSDVDDASQSIVDSNTYQPLDSLSFDTKLVREEEITSLSGVKEDLCQFAHDKTVEPSCTGPDAIDQPTNQIVEITKQYFDKSSNPLNKSKDSVLSRDQSGEMETIENEISCVSNVNSSEVEAETTDLNFIKDSALVEPHLKRPPTQIKVVSLNIVDGTTEKPDKTAILDQGSVANVDVDGNVEIEDQSLVKSFPGLVETDATDENLKHLLEISTVKNNESDSSLLIAEQRFNLKDIGTQTDFHEIRDEMQYLIYVGLTDFQHTRDDRLAVKGNLLLKRKREDEKKAFRGQLGVQQASTPNPTTLPPQTCGNDIAEINSLDNSKASSDLKVAFDELQEKYRQAMVYSAQLENERSQLQYQCQIFKDLLEEQEDNMYRLTSEHKFTSQELEKQKRALDTLEKKCCNLHEALHERDLIIQERGLEGRDEEVLGSKPSGLKLYPRHDADGVQQQTLDSQLKVLAKEKQELLEKVRGLEEELDLEKRKENVNGQESLSHDISDIQLLEIQREANKQVSEYKLKLQKSEQDIGLLKDHIARLETHLHRLKQSTETLEKNEDELRAEKRKLARDLRAALDKIEELQMSNFHLEKRLERIRATRAAMSMT